LCLVPLLRPPPLPTLFPYTTLFRSRRRHGTRRERHRFMPPAHPVTHQQFQHHRVALGASRQRPAHRRSGVVVLAEQFVEQLRLRSEEHTSELQSRENLVCRLLLEKK